MKDSPTQRLKDWAYRNAARKKLRAVQAIKVPVWGGVSPTEGGAFVECVVWVTEEEMEQSEES